MFERSYLSCQRYVLTKQIKLQTMPTSVQRGVKFIEHPSVFVFILSELLFFSFFFSFFVHVITYKIVSSRSWLALRAPIGGLQPFSKDSNNKDSGGHAGWQEQ